MKNKNYSDLNEIYNSKIANKNISEAAELTTFYFITSEGATGSFEADKKAHDWMDSGATAMGYARNKFPNTVTTSFSFGQDNVGVKIAGPKAPQIIQVGTKWAAIVGEVESDIKKMAKFKFKKYLIDNYDTVDDLWENLQEADVKLTSAAKTQAAKGGMGDEEGTKYFKLSASLTGTGKDLFWSVNKKDWQFIESFADEATAEDFISDLVAFYHKKGKKAKKVV